MNTAGNGIKYRSGSQKWAMVAILGGMVACCAASGRLFPGDPEFHRSQWNDERQAHMEEHWAARDADRDAAALRCIFDPVKAKDYKRASKVIKHKKWGMENLDIPNDKDMLSYLKFAEADGKTALHLAAEAALHDETALSVFVKLVEAVDCYHLLAKEDAKGRSAIDYISESSDARFKGIWDKYMESQLTRSSLRLRQKPSLDDNDSYALDTLDDDGVMDAAMGKADALLKEDPGMMTRAAHQKMLQKRRNGRRL